MRVYKKLGIVLILVVALTMGVVIIGGKIKRTERNTGKLMEKGAEETELAGVTEETKDTGKSIYIEFNIIPRHVSRYGNHIYLTDDIFLNADHTEHELKRMVEYLKETDQKMTMDVLVDGWTYYDDYAFRFYGRQYIDGVEIPKVRYTSEKKFSYGFMTTYYSKPEVYSLDTTSLIDPTLLIPEVKKRTRLHLSEICGYAGTQPHRIYVEYYAEYDVDTDQLYYAFDIGASRIEFDAKTGQVIGEYYWDGDGMIID